MVACWYTDSGLHEIFVKAGFDCFAMNQLAACDYLDSVSKEEVLDCVDHVLW